MNGNITRRELLERVSKATLVAGISTVASDGEGALLPARELKGGTAQVAETTASEEMLEGGGLPWSGFRARSWEPGVRIVPEHEPARAFDGIPHTYWAVSAQELPADLGIDWPQPHTVSSVVLRYFDGGMVIGPMIARTQQWARLQSWDHGEWRDIDFQMTGQETSSVRYTFSPVRTTRLRILFTEPPDPETGYAPAQLGIYVCEFETYSKPPFQLVSPPQRLVPILRPAQVEERTRCYFIDLALEIRPGEDNVVEITLPIRRGLLFSGAYLDLPDQMPSAMPQAV